MSRAANLTASGPTAFQDLSGQSLGAKVYGELSGLHASRVASCPKPRKQPLKGVTTAPSCFDQAPAETCCSYDCCAGSACGKYTNACPAKKFPEACGSAMPTSANGFPGMSCEDPGLSGSYTGFEVLATGCGGTNEYYRNMKESKMARENPTALSVCVNRELDVPFQEDIVPTKPLPVSMAGTDVFGTIMMTSNARGMTTDVRGEPLLERPIGPPPEGAGICSRMGKQGKFDGNGDCSYSNDIMHPTCAGTTQTRGSYDDSGAPHGRKATFKLPSYDVDECDGNLSTEMRTGRNDSSRYSSCDKTASRSAAKKQKAASVTPAAAKNWFQKNQARIMDWMKNSKEDFASYMSNYVAKLQ
jgi:hypothetical protein